MHNLPSNPLAKPEPTEREREAERLSREALGHADFLLRNEHFDWFLRECVKRRRTELEAIMFNTQEKTAAERELAAQVRTEIANIEGWVRQRFDTARLHLAQSEKDS